MAIALMTLTILADLGLGFAACYGFLHVSHGAGSESYHFVTGLFAAFLSVFAHCMSMFYFIGTGKVIREAIQEHELDEGPNEEARRFKLSYFPVASFTIAATMATPILGGAAQAGKVPQGVHLAAALGAIALNAGATALAWRYMWLNQGLIAEVEARCPPGS